MADTCSFSFRGIRVELERIGGILCIDCKPLTDCSKKELIAFIEQSVSMAEAALKQIRADTMMMDNLGQVNAQQIH